MACSPFYSKSRAPLPAFFFSFLAGAACSSDPARLHAGGKQRRSNQLQQQACPDVIVVVVSGVVAFADGNDDGRDASAEAAPEPLTMRSRSCRCLRFRWVWSIARVEPRIFRFVAPASRICKRELFFVFSFSIDKNTFLFSPLFSPLFFFFFILFYPNSETPAEVPLMVRAARGEEVERAPCW